MEIAIYSVSNPNCNIWFFNAKSMHNSTTVTCNTALEQKFCYVCEDNFGNGEFFSYEEYFAVFWKVAEMAHAHLKSN